MANAPTQGTPLIAARHPTCQSLGAWGATQGGGPGVTSTGRWHGYRAKGHVAAQAIGQVSAGRQFTGAYEQVRAHARVPAIFIAFIWAMNAMNMGNEP